MYFKTKTTFKSISFHHCHVNQQRCHRSISSPCVTNFAAYRNYYFLVLLERRPGWGAPLCKQLPSKSWDRLSFKNNI